MSSTDAARRHRNGWTPERRAAQARAIRNWRPWTRSTGPRTTEGKARVRYNGYKDGTYSTNMRRIRQALKKHRAFLRCYDEQTKISFKERQRQLNALRARHRKKSQLRHGLGRNNGNNFNFSPTKLLDGKKPSQDNPLGRDTGE